MAMPASVTSAKAVVGISEVHFYTHPATGEPTVDATLLASTDWFSVATLKGSVEVGQDPLSLTKINIDQSDMPIGISTEPGDFNISCNMPSMVAADLAKFLDKDTTALTMGDKQGYGYDFNAELLEMCLAIKTKTGEWLVFPNTQGSCAFGMEDNVWVLKYSGQVLGATNAGNKPVYVFADAVSANG